MANEITVLGIDLGKNWYHVVGIDQRGQAFLRKKLNRTQLGALAALDLPRFSGRSIVSGLRD
jgi:hypothetical protein